MENTANTKGLLKETVRMAWPAVLESFFVSLAGMIDTMMVSTLGTAAVAAVGLTTQPKFIALAIFLSCNVAVSALVARRRGQGNQRSANEILVTALFFTLIAVVIVSLITVAGADVILRWCGSNSETAGPAGTYYRIIQGGMIFNVISLCINSAQRGSGNTRIAMKTNMTSSVVNVICNYALINGHFGFPALGLAGAAIATVLGTVVACGMSLVSLFKKDSYVSVPFMLKEKIRPKFISMKHIASLSSNFLLENVLMRIGFLTTAVIAANLGTKAFAAHQVGMNFLSLGFAFGDGMQVAAVALIGRSLGESNPEKAKTYGSLCQRVGLLISAVLALVMIFGGDFLFSLYFSDPEILAMCAMIARYIMIVIVFQISQVVFGGALRGAGDVRYTLIVSIISVTIIRTLVTWLLSGVIMDLGLHAIWLGILADQLTRFVLLGIRFRSGKWTQISI